MGGLIGVNESWNRNRGLVSDFDNATLAGVYKISNYGGNNNPNIDDGVSMCLFVIGYILQIAVSVTDNRFKFRGTTNEGKTWGKWNDWKTV